MNTTSPAPDLERHLARLADLAVHAAVALQPGQELVVSAPIEASALVRHVARTAHRHGARAVTCMYEDPAVIRERLAESSDDALDYAPEWLNRGVVQALRAGAARLQLLGPYPDLLSGIPAERIVRAHRALASAVEEETRLTSSAAVNSSAVPVATRAWAKQVFPALAASEGYERLWATLFAVTRAAGANPRRAWEAHVRQIDARREALQALRLSSLRFFDGFTDLTVGLAPNHRWMGGSVVGANGIRHLQALPSEEVFTALDGCTARGRALFSRPVALGGTVVRNLYAEFRDGAVTTVKADEGAEFVDRLIGSGAGRRLGEVGLVAASSLVGRSGVMFWNPLLDRNAASHVAFGDPPAACHDDGRLPAGRGSHGTSVHVDCMLGRDHLNVDGMAPTGAVVPIIRDGEFVM